MYPVTNLYYIYRMFLKSTMCVSYTIKLSNMDLKGAETGVCTTKESGLWRKRFSFQLSKSFFLMICYFFVRTLSDDKWHAMSFSIIVIYFPTGRRWSNLQRRRFFELATSRFWEGRVSIHVSLRPSKPPVISAYNGGVHKWRFTRIPCFHRELITLQ